MSDGVKHNLVLSSDRGAPGGPTLPFFAMEGDRLVQVDWREVARMKDEFVRQHGEGAERIDLVYYAAMAIWLARNT